MSKKTFALLTLTILSFAAASSSPAFGANPYRIDPGGAKAIGTENVFTLEGAGSFSCPEAIYKQPNSTEKELVTEEQGLTTTYSACEGKLGKLPVKVTIGPEVEYKLGVREGAGTEFKGISVSLQKEMLLKAVSGTFECTIKASSGTNQKLKEMQWTDVKTTPGERLSTFTMSLTGGHGTSSGGVGCSEMSLEEAIRWVLLGKAKQSGES